MAQCAQDITRVSLELGGKSANVIFADADLDRWVERSVFAVFDNAGQDCCARFRVLVERPIYEEFTERMAWRTAELRVGAPLEESTEIGPMIARGSGRPHSTIWRSGSRRGPQLVTGGEIPEDASGGFFSPPGDPGRRGQLVAVAPEEIFGPVACVTRSTPRRRPSGWPTTTPYGLSGSIWTNDLGRAIRVAGARSGPGCCR
jgi:acyl-CoA reductase-like NAD-dependent aldehyde dehydrogenase